MTQIGYHTLLLVCDWCICLYMNKTIWFVHDAWYTSLQLLEFGVGVEGLLLCWSYGWFACPAPPGELDASWLFAVVVKMCWTAVAVQAVLVFFCSCDLPCEAAVDGWIKWLGFWLWKAFIWPAMASLVDSTTSYPGDSLGVCVACTHAAGLVCCLCVCGLGLGLVEWISSAAWSYPPYVIFANLPSGFAKLGLMFCLLCVCAGIKKMLKMNSRSSWSKNSWRSQCSLGHLNTL
jgi:hypothetical protein